MPVEFYIGRMRYEHLVLVAIALIGPLTAAAQERRQIPLPAAQGILPDVSGAVWAGNILFVSGWLDPDLETHTDIKSQTIGVYKDIQKFLESQKLTLGDVVMIHAYIGSEAEHAGYSAGYNEIFGTDQPNKPAHTLLQVVLPAARHGALVEIDIIAVRPT
jgi:enamine deaminase RidA (YjgF/YER057c/UK114 family)